jgi:hypothetical protein
MCRHAMMTVSGDGHQDRLSEAKKNLAPVRGLASQCEQYPETD